MNIKSIRNCFILLIGLSVGSTAAAGTPRPAWVYEAYQDAYRLQAEGEWEASADILKEVLTSEPRAYEANLRLGWLSYWLGEHEHSLKFYSVAAQVAPRATEPQLGLMLPLLAQRRFVEVEQRGYRILKDDPYNYYANLRLTAALLGAGKFGLARGYAEKMLARYPADTLILSQLAHALDGVGEKGSAARLRDQVEMLVPAQP